MVFESIVTDLMNRFLGDFIENLDKKQLNIGIWGGDVVLKNLQLKQSALKELDLPVQLVYGQLGKLVLKIPWKNLYSLPVEADVEDLYLLVAPNSAVNYNAEKQSKMELELKKTELAKVEEAKKRELEKDKPKADKSFTEKLVAQIINNVQIRIRNVHIRYEDRSTSTIPFALGVTLSGLEVHTTNADWQKAFLSEALSKVFKVAKLDGLAVYMNCNTTLFQSRSDDEYTQLFMDTIATSESRPENFTYVLGPITSVAKLKLNMNPELDEPPFEVPKVDLYLEMEKLAVGITRAQYQRLIELADGMGALNRGIPYRKFRPFETPYKGNAKVWWQFAYKAILETEIKRRKQNWSWLHMLEHRNLCRTYAEAYRTKLTCRKVTADIQKNVDTHEECLDLFNLLLIRNRVDLEVEKSGILKKQEEKQGSWFSGWWGSSKSAEDDGGDKDILNQFKTAMTPEEKEKLYQAIGYHEDGIDLQLPEEYIALTAHFNLKLLEVCVRNEVTHSSLSRLGIDEPSDKLQTILSLQVSGVSCEVDQRPAASGLKLDLNMKEFTVFGYKQKDFVPVVVKSILGQTTDNSLLDIAFEMNPLDKRCDQRVDISARPLQIVYDAETIIQLLQVFKLPKDANLSELTDAAADKLSNFKERSATGIQYMIEKHTRLEVNISVQPNYVIVPYGGVYIENEVEIMVISLGSISLKTEPSSQDAKDIASMHVSGITSDEILKNIMDRAYDKFNLNIDHIQILLAKQTDSWRDALTQGQITKLHILAPTSLQVKADLCVVDDDPRLPKTRIQAKIPSVCISMTEQRVLDAISLAASIPLPEADVTEPMGLTKEGILHASSMSLKRYLDERQLAKPKRPEVKQRDALDEEITQYTDLEFAFELSEVSVNIYKDSEVVVTPNSKYETPTEEFQSATGTIMTTSESVSELELIGLPKQLSFKVKQLEMAMVQRTYDMKVSMKLGAIAMDQYHHPFGNPTEQIKITLIETPRYAETNDYLLSLFYTNANKTSPEFTTKYKSTEQLIEINFTILNLRLHQEGLTEILQFANDFQVKTDEILAKKKLGVDRIASAGSPLETIDEGDENEDAEVAVTEKPAKSVAKRDASIVDSIKVKVIAKMEQVAIEVESEKRPITNLKIQNLHAGVIMKTSYTEVSVKLQDIVVLDLNRETIHSTILSVVGGDALSCQIVLYNLEETSVYNSNNMKIDVSMGCVKIIFLNWFINSVLNFLNNFQAAQQAIADASAAAAETAKQNMVEAYSNATRMLLNVRIKAPIIIVPVDSKSLKAITIDLGYLCISNNCVNIPNTAKNDHSEAVLDEMKLELKDMKIAKVDLLQNSEDRDAVDGCLENVENILNPTTFALIIKRNLSAGWYKELPELDVSGRLKSIVVNLMATDYHLLMSILAKNMTEGADECTAVAAAPAPKRPEIVMTPISNAHFHAFDETDEIGLADSEETRSRTSTTVKRTSKIKAVEVDVHTSNGQKSSAPKKEVATFLQFAFQMDSIVLNLYTAPKQGLASFGIHFLSLKGHKLVDESLSASVVLCDVQLDDIRPDRQNFITKFMKKKEIENMNAISADDSDVIAPQTSMVDIVAHVKQDETFANLKVSSFDLILSLEFLLKIAQFLALPEDATSPAKPVAAPACSSTPRPKTESAVVAAVAAEVESTKKVTILLNVEQPDIILVEKMDDINCLALILNTQIALRVRILGEKQVIEGEIADLKFYICEFNPARRNATKHFIIQPCTISLHGNTPEALGMNISLSTSDIRINISPAIIELLNKAVTTVTATEVKDESVQDEFPDYSDLWKIEQYKEDDFWFMKVEEAEEVLVIEDYSPLPIAERKPEVCIVEVPSIVIVIETGFGYYTYPMLVIETKMNAEIRDWSSQISIQSSLSLGMAYYNSIMAVWEPLIEPNERDKPNGLTEYLPWELNFSLKIEKSVEDSCTDAEPKTKISISSSDTLELSVTKTSLDVLQDLGQAFSDAIRPQGLTKPDVIAPYIVENDTGFDISLNLKRGALNLHSSHLPNSSGSTGELNKSGVVFKASSADLDPNQITTCKISPGGRAYLQAKQNQKMSIISAFDASNGGNLKESLLHISVGDIDKEITLPIHKADRRYFPLYRDTKQEPWGIISHVRTEYGSTIVTVHGVLKIKNYFTTPVNVFRMRNGALIEVGQVKPGSTFNVPLHALYAANKDLFFSIANYKTSVQGFNWKENPSDFKYTKYLQCDPIHTFEPFYITAIREREEVYHEVTSKYTMLSACYVINLKPPLYLRNALPIDIQISVAGCTVSQTENAAAITEHAEENHVDRRPDPNATLTKADFLDYGEKVVKPGDILHLPTVKTTAREGERRSLLVVRLVQYLEKDWSCKTEIPAIPPEFAVWSFYSYDSEEKMSIELGVKFDNHHGSLQLTVYCPFWMINKTGLMLSYRSSDENVNVLYHPPDHEGPILFSYREKVFFGKKRASLRVENGDWSDKFSLDAAGSTGVVECKADGLKYEIAVHNTLTHNSLTKQITFMPFYVLMNKAPFTIQVQDDKRPGDPWLTVEPEDCAPLWPKSDNKTLHVRVKDDETISRPFKFNDVQCSLLKMKNRYGGVNVDVQVTEGGVYITFSAYHPGDAPALIINHTDRLVKFWEKGNVNERSLKPMEKMLYTWQAPAGDRVILWDENDKTIENDLRRDGINQVRVGEDRTSYWVSFLDGTQRVLLFTDLKYIASEANSASGLEQVTQEVEVDIHGIGLSLVNNSKQCDIMYIGIASSGVIWEEKKKSRFKQMKIQEVHDMEERYQEYLRDQEVGTSNVKYFLDAANKVEIDFNQRLLMKSTPRQIRRIFYPGLWIQMKSSPYQLQLHAKINRIQIDNQLTDCIFPVVLAPVPPPKSVAATTELKPFVECSIVQRIIPHSNVKQFKYLKVLTQEFHVKVDLLFINEIVELFSTELTDEEKRKLFNDDIKRQNEPLSAFVLTQSTQEQKNFYDQLHLGPLKIHISFSMAGLQPGALPPVLSTILQGVGVTLTDINDIVFRLSFFEREYNFFTHRQLTSEIISHYTGQAVKQAYVLILGLDVIGNPYGLVVGFTKGVEDLFYEPFQGAIQGPSEFAEGLVLGVKSLFGHTVGGAAGAVSKITGAMGKGLAALTFDKDYQKKRREALNKKPANLQEGLARSSKGLVMGVFDGVTGVFTKPISGAKSDGVEGFFKGLGKGAVGLVARPTAGIVDFASGSFDAVKRAAEMSEEVNRLRPPRFLRSDGVLRPFCVREAEGNKLLKEIEKGKYATSDTFAHFEVILEKRDVLLLSDHRVLYCTRNDLFGGWQIDWTYSWSEIHMMRAIDRGIELLIGEKPKKVLGLFGSSEQQKKFILIAQQARRERLLALMDKLKANEP